MRKTVISTVAAALLLAPVPALAASDPDLCSFVRTDNERQDSVRTRLTDGRLISVAPGFCTQPGEEVLRFALADGLSYQIKWRDPRNGYSGTLWVDGYRLIQPEKNGLKYRILDIEVNEKTEN